MRIRSLLLIAALVAIPVAVIAEGNVLPPARPMLGAVPSAPPIRQIPPSTYARPMQPLPAPPARVIFAESFVNDASSPNAWSYGGNACITAGDSSTPSTSIPACGANAPQDPSGSGALELSPPVNYEDGYVLYNRQLRTDQGLSAKFNYYSFDTLGNTVGDGLAFVLTHGGEPLPTQIGGCCGSLGYAPYILGNVHERGLLHGYLAVGLDESGVFTQPSNGKTGGTYGLSNLITLRGALRTHAQYLLSTLNGSGKPAPLPFSLSDPKSPTRPTALTFTITLSPAGTISVSIDRNDGNGPAVYISPTSIVGLNGQPALPKNVYVGFTAAGGGANARHQINDLVVSTAPAAFRR